ncbi:hypothetical protein L6R52_23105 [Myxococcota bacterium]|nr:hypothetical protein [Myxococcota bacterium]
MSEIVQRIGRDLVLASVSVLRTIMSHGADNQAARAGLDRMRQMIELHLESMGGLRLDVVDEMLLLNGTRLRAASLQAPQFAALAKELNSRGVGGFAISERVGLDALRMFFALLAQRIDSPAQLDAVRASIFRNAPRGITPLEVRTLATADLHDTARPGTMAFALRAYARVILAFREFVAAVRDGRNPYTNRLGVARAVQDLIDAAFVRADLVLYAMQLEKARGAVSGLAYAEVHAAGSCVYAILVGRVLELERTALLDLGTSALLADAGASLVLDGAATSNAVLDAAQKADLERQRTRGVQALLGEAQGNDDSALLRTIVAYEHRRPIATSTAVVGEPLHVLSRIVAVASAFDAMTTDRPWRAAMSMHEALDTLTRESGTKFDPLLVGTLSALLGTYFGEPDRRTA